MTASVTVTEPFRLIVTGSRDWSDEGLLEHALEAAAAEHPVLVVVHGKNRRGADFAAGRWARRQQAAGRQVTEEPHPADWNAPCRPGCARGHRGRGRGGLSYCPAAGNYRNQEMADAGAGACLSFFQPGAVNRGTSDCTSRVVAAGIPVTPFGAVPPAIRALLDGAGR
jgi:hypothetical protein